MESEALWLAAVETSRGEDGHELPIAAWDVTRDVKKWGIDQEIDGYRYIYIYIYIEIDR